MTGSPTIGTPAIGTPTIGTGATALVMDRPGDRFTPQTWRNVLLAVGVVALTAVSIPTLSALYGGFVPLAFLVAGAHATALVLTATRPAVAIGLSAVTVLATAAVTAGADLAWPLPVVTMITQLLLCAFIAVRGRVGPAIAALLVSVLAASAPLILALGQEDLWQVGAGNLATFGCLALLVTALGLGISRFIPWERTQPSRLRRTA